MGLDDTYSPPGMAALIFQTYRHLLHVRSIITTTILSLSRSNKKCECKSVYSTARDGEAMQADGWEVGRSIKTHMIANLLGDLNSPQLNPAGLSAGLLFGAWGPTRRGRYNHKSCSLGSAFSSLSLPRNS